MHKTILGLLVFAGLALGADMTGTLTIINVTSTGVRACYHADPGFPMQTLKIGYAPKTYFDANNAFLKYSHYRDLLSGAYNTEYCLGIGGLKPGTTYTFGAVATANSGADSTVYVSPGYAGNRAEATTSAAVPNPTRATLPADDPIDNTFPAVADYTYPLATTCTELVDQITEAQTDSTRKTQHVQITLPHALSGTCTFRMNPEARSSTGKLLLISQWAGFMTPAGHRLKAADDPYLFTVYAPTGNDGWLGAGNTAGTAYTTFVGVDVEASAADGVEQKVLVNTGGSGNKYSAITFDRCKFRDPRSAPYIGGAAMFIRGDSIKILGCRFLNIIHSQANGAFPVEGPQGIDILEGQYILIEDCEIEVNGINIFLEGDYATYETGVAVSHGKPVKDVKIYRNYIYSNPDYRGLGTNLVSGRRHGGEGKVGERVEWKGNVFNYGFHAITGTGAAIVLKADTTNLATGAYTRHWTIHDNLVINGTDCFGASGAQQDGYFYSRIQYVTIDNNVCITDADEWRNKSFFTYTDRGDWYDNHPEWFSPDGSGASGKFFYNYGGNLENVVITRNTHYGKGGWPRFIHLGLEAASANFYVEGNISFSTRGAFGGSTVPVTESNFISMGKWWTSDPYNYGSSFGFSHNPILFYGGDESVAFSHHGKPVLDLLVTSDDGTGGFTPETSYIERDNLFIPLCNYTSGYYRSYCTPDRTDLTNADLTNYPNDKFDTTGASVAARVLNIFTDQTNWRLPVTSQYLSGGANHALSGYDMGATIDAQWDSRGIVRNAYVRGTTLYYTPPAASTCTIRVDGTDTVDTPAAGQRSFSIAGASTTPKLYCQGGQQFSCPLTGGFCSPE